MPPVSSNESYLAFVMEAYTYLKGRLDKPPLMHSKKILQLYNLYCDYDSNKNAGVKVRLKDQDLYKNLLLFFTATGKRPINVQSVSWTPLLDISELKKDLQIQIDSKPPPKLPETVSGVLDSYLHVYPIGTEISKYGYVTQTKYRRAGNWRIGINVKPTSIAMAASRLMDILDNNKVIDHIKFESPDVVGKPDSVIIYLSKGGKHGANKNEYARIRTLIQNAFTPGKNDIKSIEVLPKFAPMWNEFKPGIAEAAEPPRYGGSFGTYRCILTYLAFPKHKDKAAKLTEDAYLDRVGDVFEIFGIPDDSPHEQGPLTEPPFDKAVQTTFLTAKALYEGKSRTAYQNYKLIDR